jgi:hypothetical protein
MIVPMRGPRRWVLVFTLISFVSWGTWEMTRPPTNPFMDLSGRFTDHFSHMNAGRVFLRAGTEVWRRPLVQLLPRPDPGRYRALPDDVKRCADCLFVAPGWEKPVLQSWPYVVRFYPPGDMLLTAPVAALYHFTRLSFTDANRLLLVLFLAAAHAGLFVMLDGLAAPRLGVFHLLPAWLGVNAILLWTLEGFYDAAMVLPLLLCWLFLGQRRALAACVAFSAAAVLHFRAYYYAPWVLTAAALIADERQWRTWRGRDLVAVAAAIVMGAASLGSFFLTLPGLLAVRASLSPLLVIPGHVDGAALLGAALVAGVAIGAFLYAGAWTDVAMTLWVALILTQVRQSYPWYTVAAVPWLCAPPSSRPDRIPLVFEARILVFLALALFVHADGAHVVEAVVPSWIPRLLF